MAFLEQAFGRIDETPECVRAYSRPALTIDRLVRDLSPGICAAGGIGLEERGGFCNGQPLGRLGSLEIRLAANAADVRRAQSLRYKVFYEEMAAAPGPWRALARRDIDGFDAICDHLLVYDDNHRTRHFLHPPPVGTYRLLRQSMADHYRGFYTADEFAIGSLLQRHRGLRFLELGRSCVLPTHRTRRTVELLWHGIWAYIQRHGIDVLIGCASFNTTDPDRLALPLSFLHHFAAAPEDWRVRALPSRYVEMNRLPKNRIDIAAATKALPPLIKGYLRVGAYVGQGAVIDRPFGTTDVFVILPVAAIKQKYVDHFCSGAERYAA